MADPGTLVILFLIFFGILEFALVIIPAMIHRSKSKGAFRPEFDIPIVLSRPVSLAHAEQMRSWYFDRNTTRGYIWQMAREAPPADHADLPWNYPPLPSGSRDGSQTEAGMTPEAILRARRAIRKANSAIRQANDAINEANAAIRDAGADDQDWMDDVAGMEEIHRL